MPTLFETTLINILTKTQFPLGDPVKDGLPAILLPIDVGAKTLLERYSEEQPQWNVFEVESLVEILSNRLTSCINLRERAQNLEVLALEALLEYDRSTQLFQLERKEIELRKTWEPRLAQNKIESDGSSSFWDSLAEIGSERTNLAKKILEERKNKIMRSGSGYNYVERFEAIQKIFKDRFCECYRLARTVAAGLKMVYGIEHPLPQLIEIGYLTELATWIGQTVEILDRELSFRSEIPVCLTVGTLAREMAIKPLIPLNKFQKQLSAGILTFDLTLDTLKSFIDEPKLFTNPRLRGIRPCIIRNDKTYNDYWRIRIDLPKQTIFGQEISRVIQTVSANSDTLPSGELTWLSAVHNLDPIGPWEIRLSTTGLVRNCAMKNDYFGALLLELKISYGMK